MADNALRTQAIALHTAYNTQSELLQFLMLRFNCQTQLTPAEANEYSRLLNSSHNAVQNLDHVMSPKIRKINLK